MNAWQYALDQYDYFARDSYPSYYVEQTKASNRQLFDGFLGLDPAKLKPHTYMYKGKEQVIQPTPVEETLQRYEIKWRELEPVLRAYYKAS